jgi:hypothetical protein
MLLDYKGQDGFFPCNGARRFGGESEIPFFLVRQEWIGGRHSRFLWHVLNAFLQADRRPDADFDFVKGVAVALEELDLLPAKAEDLVAVGQLKDAHQRFGVEAVGHDNQLGNRPPESVNSEHAGRAQHRQSVMGVIPEVGRVGQSQKRLQERLDLMRRVLLPQRLLQRLNEVAKPNRILLVFRKVPMSRLVERDARRLMGVQEPGLRSRFQVSPSFLCLLCNAFHLAGALESNPPNGIGL